MRTSDDVLASGQRTESITKDLISSSDNNHICAPPRSHGSNGWLLKKTHAAAHLPAQHISDVTVGELDK